MTLAVALLAGVGAALPQAAPAGNATNKGTLTLLTGFGGPYNEPGALIEVSPGRFVGIAVSDNAAAFELSSAGALSTLFTFPANAGPVQPLVQAIDGQIYGTQTVPSSNFSLAPDGKETIYQSTTIGQPWLSLQFPDGALYGTTWGSAGHNAFVQMTVHGTATVVHNFTQAEGEPYGLPIRASDGNFYGISAVPLPPSRSSTSAMVYRVTPQGVLTVIATYPDGRPGYAVGFTREYLLQATNGMLYGTAAFGGTNEAGAIFQLSLDGAYTNSTNSRLSPPGFPHSSPRRATETCMASRRASTNSAAPVRFSASRRLANSRPSRCSTAWKSAPAPVG
jgi:hypothetical protein